MAQILELLSQNLLSPVVLAFFLGVIASILRSDLRFPESVYQALSIYLLFAIGLKGGASFSETSFADVWRALVVAMALGAITPVTSFLVLYKLGKFGRADAAGIAAHYGSVSAVTFLAGLNFLTIQGIESEPFLPALVAFMEIPGIVLAIAIAKTGSEQTTSLGTSIREVLVGKSVILLLGGFVIGTLSGAPGLKSVEGLFVTPFKGVLALFLLEMGILAAQRLRDLKKTGVFLILFGILAPIVHGSLGLGAAWLAGMSQGGALIVALLAASASYIAAPAAVRSAIPEANPTYSLTASLGITFPFNIAFGIPLLYLVSSYIYS